MQALQPLRDAFASLSPVFDAIGEAISRVWDWFKQLFTPVESSRESLEKCTSAGETFGKVFGFWLQTLLTPLTVLMDGVSWLLEKLDLIPSGLEKAQTKVNGLKKGAETLGVGDKQFETFNKGLNEKRQGTLGSKSGNNRLEIFNNGLNDKPWESSGENLNLTLKGSSITPPPIVPPPSQPLSGESGTMHRLQNIDNNTGGILNETQKRIGPGDIVFKNLPRAFAVQGAWQETRVAAQKVPRVVSQQMQDITMQPVRQAQTVPVSASPSAAPSFNLVFNDVGKQDPRELAQLVEQKIRQILNERDRTRRGSFRDQD